MSAFTLPRRLLQSTFLVGGLFACTVPQVDAAQTAISDAQSILALDLLAPGTASIAALALTALQALLKTEGSNLVSATSGESSTLTLLATAMKQIQTNTPVSSKAYADAGIALQVLSSGGSPQQIESAGATALIEYLALNGPKTAALGGTSKYAGLVSDARSHLGDTNP